MYYLMNENNKIIGADTSLLDHLKVEDLNDFLKEVALENISFEEKGNEIAINFRGNTESYVSSRTKAITLLGNVDVVYFEKAIFKDVVIGDGKNTKIHLDIDPDNINLKLLAERIGVSEEDYTSFLKDFIELSNELKESLINPQKEIYTEAVTKITNLADMLSVGSLSNELHSLIDLDSIEKKGTINTFYSKINAIFSDGTETIHLAEDPEPEVEAKPEPKVEVKPEPKVEVKPEPKAEVKPEEKKDTFELDLDLEEPVVEETPKEEVVTDKVELDLEEAPADAIELPEEDGLNPNIDLSSVEPVHFDFQMSHAADDLGIPVEIIEEFVLEYIDQAEEETVNLIQAYREDDLERVQEIGHLLKGAASNLRIDPLAQTLYDIQFCEDITQIPQLTKTYWGKFLSFRTQIKK